MMNTIKNVVILITNSIENKTNGLVYSGINNIWVSRGANNMKGSINSEKSEVI